MNAASRRWRRRGLLLAAMAVVTGFVMLGRWQLSREAYKRELLAATAQLLAQRDPQPLAAATDAPTSALAWSEGRGHFVDVPALLLDNQQRDGRVGVHVYRLFAPDGARRALLVDLGWLPLPGDRTLPVVALPRGMVTLRGLLSTAPAPGLALGPAEQIQPDGTRLLTRIEPAALAQSLRRPLAPRVLRLDPALALGYPRDLDVLSNTLSPEKHRGYAVQWFALAAAVSIISLLLALRRPPSSRAKS